MSTIYMNIVHGLRLILLLASFIMACVGTARPQFSYEDIHYKFDGIHTNGWKIKYGDANCKSFQSRMRAGHAFAVLTCIFIALAMICTVVFLLSFVVNALKNATGVLRIASIGLMAVAFVFSIVAWSISASALHESFCDQRPLHHQGYHIDDGMGLLIGAWILLLVDLVVCVAALIWTLRQPKQ